MCRAKIYDFFVPVTISLALSSSESLDDRLLLEERLPDCLSSLSLPLSSEYISEAFNFTDDLTFATPIYVYQIVLNFHF